MKFKGLILFDIDGVIRDVSLSYRLAIKKTVECFCEWEPSLNDIDNLKSEGIWNNDWDASLELIKRKRKSGASIIIPTRKDIRLVFDKFYFGADLSQSNDSFNGFINNENLLVDKDFFNKLSSLNIAWGFVSGTEHASAKFVLEKKLGLNKPPLIAMGDAPEKPDPRGFLSLIKKIFNTDLKNIKEPIGYVGDTVADVLTVINARSLQSNLNLISFAISPPHLHSVFNKDSKIIYEKILKEKGADIILEKTNDLIKYVQEW